MGSGNPCENRGFENKRPVNITKQENEDAVTLKLEGEVAMFSMEAVRGAFFETLQGERKPVLLDLSLVSKIDSTGIGQLVDFQNRLKGQERKLILCEINRTVREMLELAQIDKLFLIKDTVATALEPDPEPEPESKPARESPAAKRRQGRINQW